MSKAQAKETPVEQPVDLDPVAEQLVALGLVPNTYHLDLDRCLQVDHSFPLAAPWNLNSRLFHFPIEVSAVDCNGVRTLGLMHAGLKDHPYVQHVEGLLGLPINQVGAANQHGYSKSGIGTWWHAVDLITQNPEALLETRRFTTTPDIARAVGYALGSRYEGVRCFTPKTAREVLGQIGSFEPADSLDHVKDLARPSVVKVDGEAATWPVNSGAEMEQYDSMAWALIVGIERGWMDYGRGRHLQWTAQGRDRYDSTGGNTYIEQTTGQGAFAF